MILPEQDIIAGADHPKIIIQRNALADQPHDSTLGLMSFGNHTLFTLEPSAYCPIHEGHPCIPAGEYLAEVTHSPNLHYDTLELQDVPNRENIRIHIGNYPSDTLGCILVGVDIPTKGVSIVEHSAYAFFVLMAWVVQQTDKVIKVIVKD